MFSDFSFEFFEFEFLSDKNSLLSNGFGSRLLMSIYIIETTADGGDSNDDIGFVCCEFSVFSFVVLLNISLLILSISSGKAKLYLFLKFFVSS